MTDPPLPPLVDSYSVERRPADWSYQGHNTNYAWICRWAPGRGLQYIARDGSVIDTENLHDRAAVDSVTFYGEAFAAEAWANYWARQHDCEDYDP